MCLFFFLQAINEFDTMEKTGNLCGDGHGTLDHEYTSFTEMLQQPDDVGCSQYHHEPMGEEVFYYLINNLLTITCKKKNLLSFF